MSVYFLMLFIFNLLLFCIVRKHILLMLLSLEFMVVTIFLSMSWVFSMMGYEYYFMLLYLVFTVCESALGLSILVSMIRSHGNDYLFSISPLSW